MNETHYPREYARTQNYTLGAPRTFRVSKNGKRVFFLRSISSSEKVLDLWYIDDQEHSDPHVNEKLLVRFNDLEREVITNKSDPAAERVRRERLREAANGITTYSIDASGDVVAFSVGGDVYVVYVEETPRILMLSADGATDVKLSPNGKIVAFVSRGEVYFSRLIDINISTPKRISPPASENVSWGLPEFVAAEEMHRHEGYWWSPDSDSIVFTGVDVSEVPLWHIANPTDPFSSTHTIRYPHAGANNARLSLLLWSDSNGLRKIKWDNEEFPYLVAVRWRGSEPTAVVQDRSQHRVHVLAVNSATGASQLVYEKKDPNWVELIEGVPTWSRAERIIDAPDAEPRRLKINGKSVSNPEAEVRKFVGELSCGGLIYLASEDPTETHVWMTHPDGTLLKLSDRPGVFGAETGGDTVVVFGAEIDDQPLTSDVIFDCSARRRRVRLTNYAGEMSIRPRPVFFQAKQRAINYSVLFPKGFRQDRKLPVLMDPYGGPWIQRCIKSSLSYTTSQWFADQGFAVIVADGRGTPGRGREWEKAVAGNLIKPALEDQVAALEDAVETGIPIDPTKVAIRGWSFGGYLAALAVILEPNRFQAAIAGAPVTDWRLYDTHYTERYLGDPAIHKHQYDSCSAIVAAHKLRRPLLLIHGFSDDNVVCAHTLRLSQALFKAGREHCVLPLTGITHMAASETAAENLLRLQLSFLKTALGI